MMKNNKFLMLTLLVGLLFLPSLQAAELTAQQKKMLGQLDQLDLLDQLDFSEQNEKAMSCIRARDFACAEKKLAEAAKYASNSKDRDTLSSTKQSLIAERQQAADEAKAEKERLLAEQQRRVYEEQMRIAQEQRAQKAREHNANMRGLVAIAGAAAIGGSMKGYSDAQRREVVDAYVRDVANDTGGSNMNAAADKVLRERKAQHNAQMQALAEKKQAEALAVEAANNEKRLRDAWEANAEQQRLETQRAQVSRPKAAGAQPNMPKYQPQNVILPTWAKNCPPGSSPARHPGGGNVTSAPAAYCIKDPNGSAAQGPGNSATTLATARQAANIPANSSTSAADAASQTASSEAKRPTVTPTQAGEKRDLSDPDPYARDLKWSSIAGSAAQGTRDKACTEAKTKAQAELIRISGRVRVDAESPCVCIHNSGGKFMESSPDRWNCTVYAKLIQIRSNGDSSK